MDSVYEIICLIVEEVDIIEVGIILCVGEGVCVVCDLKVFYLYKIVLVDVKIVDVGKIFFCMCFEVNVDWVMVICCVDINIVKGVLDVVKEFNGDMQIELIGYWIWEQVQQWCDVGIQQVVYYCSCDVQVVGVVWGEVDIIVIKCFFDMGFKVIVIGGLVLEDLLLFKGILIYVFIVGCSICDAAFLVEVVCQFKCFIVELWG